MAQMGWMHHNPIPICRDTNRSEPADFVAVILGERTASAEFCRAHRERKMEPTFADAQSTDAPAQLISTTSG